MERWVKIYDSILEWEWSDDPNMVSLWVHLLLRANYKDKKWHGIEVKRGQLVTGRAVLSELTGLSERSIRTCLARLQETGEIFIKTTNKYSIITICKYERYQQNEKTNDQQTTSKRPANDQQTTTTLERIEEVEYNNNLSDDKLSSLKEVVDFFNEQVTISNSTIPKVRSASGKRAGYIKARIREHGIEAVKEMILIAVKSDFLNGKNQRGWTANFDWLFLPSNFQKVLEGNYDRTKNNTSNYYHTGDEGRNQRAAAIAERMAELAAEDDNRALRKQGEIP